MKLPSKSLTVYQENNRHRNTKFTTVLEPDALQPVLQSPLDNAQAAWSLVRVASLRVEFFVNAPVKGILELPIEYSDLTKSGDIHPALTAALATIITRLQKGAPHTLETDHSKRDLVNARIRTVTAEFLLDQLEKHTAEQFMELLLREYIRSFELHVEFYKNTRLFGVDRIALPREGEAAADLQRRCAKLITQAVREALLKTLADQRPGG